MGINIIHLSYFLLLLLLSITIGVSSLSHGISAHLFAYAFAVAKSFVILFIFMKLKLAENKSVIFFCLSLVMLFILVSFTLDDLLFRDHISRGIP